MSTVTLEQFTSDSLRMLRSAFEGEEIIITDGNIPRAKVSPMLTPIANREEYLALIGKLRGALKGMNTDNIRDETDREL